MARADGRMSDTADRFMTWACCGSGRRFTLRVLAGMVAGAVIRPGSAQTQPADLVQPREPGPAGFAARAFEMRRRAVERGDQPYGAVVVKDARIVGEGVSAVVTDRDPAAHAEMQAIRDAMRRLGTSDLTGCELYGTSRACPMCEGAAYRAGIARMYHGAEGADAGPPRPQ